VITTFKMMFTIGMVCLALFTGCGGGADIGNPGNTVMGSLSGSVKTTDSKGASGARVVIGRYCELPLDKGAPDTISGNGIIIVINNRVFDTAICDNAGTFYFDDIVTGEYVITATLDKKGISMPVVIDGGDNEADLRLADLSGMTVNLYTLPDTTKPYLVSARITGTEYTATVDSSGVIRFDSVPSGFKALTVFKSDAGALTIEELVVAPGEKAVITADPSRDLSYWTVRTAYHLWDARPFVERHGRWNDSILTPDSSVYDLFVQFSHPMDTYITSGALQCSSPDSTVKIDKMLWHGSDLLLVRLCVRDSLGACNRFGAVSMSSVTITVGTAAVSTYGISLVYPEVLKF